MAADKFQILIHIISERNAQEEKWGSPNLSPVEWLAVLMEEVGEVAKEVVDNQVNDDTGMWDNYRNELLQVAAVAIAAIECLDNQEKR